MENINMNPAENASSVALKSMFKAIEESKCFRIEAGAGAGKTYSLIQAINFSFEKYGCILKTKKKRIACITYTNVAKNEIIERTEHNPLILAETIHAFCWSLLSNFQKQIRNCLSELSERWKERIEEYGDISKQKIVYDLGYPSITETEITLHHDDVIRLMTMFLKEKKFVTIISSIFPIIFIDEYQDTNIDLANAIVENIIDEDVKVIIGLFGDHWQKIYGSNSCGLIQSKKDKIVEIGVEANFRSDLHIVNILNKMRPELSQRCYNPQSSGMVYVFHSNDWKGSRRTESHWKGDLPSEIARDYLEKVKIYIRSLGVEEEKTKILMLTNTLLANEQGYSNLASVFSDNDDFLKLNDAYVKYFVEVVEVISNLFSQKKYGEMFGLLGNENFRIKNKTDKEIWSKNIGQLIEIRSTGTIDEIVSFLAKTKRPRLSSKIEDKEEMLARYSSYPDEKKEELKKAYDKINALKKVSYLEVIALTKYINDQTPFATNHGVKGAQFDNVISVFGRGWNQYNWNQMLEWFVTGVPDGKDDAFERSRNLFYVACSRAKHNLFLVFTQELSSVSLQLLTEWFGQSAILSIESL